jgi:hypothetical protein
VVIVPVPASTREPAHEHADLRFVLATRTPDSARAENPDAPVRWLSPGEAREISSEANLRETVSRAEELLAAAPHELALPEGGLQDHAGVAPFFCLRADSQER